VKHFVKPASHPRGNRLCAAVLAGALAAFCAFTAVAADQGGITLNFKDADIREVAATIG